MQRGFYITCDVTGDVIRPNNEQRLVTRNRKSLKHAVYWTCNFCVGLVLCYIYLPRESMWLLSTMRWPLTVHGTPLLLSPSVFQLNSVDGEFQPCYRLQILNDFHISLKINWSGWFLLEFGLLFMAFLSKYLQCNSFRAYETKGIINPNNECTIHSQRKSDNFANKDIECRAAYRGLRKSCIYHESSIK